MKSNRNRNHKKLRSGYRSRFWILAICGAALLLTAGNTAYAQNSGNGTNVELYVPEQNSGSDGTYAGDSKDTQPDHASDGTGAADHQSGDNGNVDEIKSKTSGNKTSGDGQAVQSTGASVKTGDDSSLLIWQVTLLAGGMTVGIWLMIWQKKRDEEGRCNENEK